MRAEGRSAEAAEKRALFCRVPSLAVIPPNLLRDSMPRRVLICAQVGAFRPARKAFLAWRRGEDLADLV
jgi:hypothetical protein